MAKSSHIGIVPGSDRHFYDVLVGLHYAITNDRGSTQGHFRMGQCSNNFREIPSVADCLHRLIVSCMPRLYGLTERLCDSGAKTVWAFGWCTATGCVAVGLDHGRGGNDNCRYNGHLGNPMASYGVPRAV
jgi:hypothetical protein